MDAVMKAEPQPQRNPVGNAQKLGGGPPPPPPPSIMQQNNANQGNVNDQDGQQMQVDQQQNNNKFGGNQGGQQNRGQNRGNQNQMGGGQQGGGNRGNRGGRGNVGGGNRFSGGGNRQNNFQNRQKGNDGGNQGQGGGMMGGGMGGGRDNQDNRDRKGGGVRMRNGGGEEFQITQKLGNLQGPTHDLPSIVHEEVKFSGRNRLYIGNLTSDITEEELKELFKDYGEISEVFLNAEKFFAFVKIDYRANAEKAKRELDGFVRKNRALRVRFAPNATAIRVKNLTQFVTNELLFKAFEVFGQVEKAVIIVDDRGKPIGEGIVEYSRKSGAMAAIRYCTEKCYFLTSSLRPCVVEIFEHSDDADGYPEKALGKKSQEFFQARSVGPRFAEPKSFEHEYGTRWKQLHELYKQKHEALRNEMKLEEEKLEAQMEYARYEHETEMLRNQLRQREMDREQRKTTWEMKEKYADEQRMKSEEQLRRAQEEMALRMGKQEDELRRRQQENSLFMQSQQMNNMMDGQDVDNFNNMPPLTNSGMGNMGNMRKLFDNRGGNQDSMMDFGQNNRGGGGNMGGGNRGAPRGQWTNNQQHNDGGFQNKRRRF